MEPSIDTPANSPRLREYERISAPNLVACAVARRARSARPGRASRGSPRRDRRGGERGWRGCRADIDQRFAIVGGVYNRLPVDFRRRVEIHHIDQVVGHGTELLAERALAALEELLQLVRQFAVIVTGIREDLTLAARNALLNMIDLLQERGWSREQAYAICSVAVDLKISNAVDLPNVTVSAFLPEDIFQ